MSKHCIACGSGGDCSCDAVWLEEVESSGRLITVNDGTKAYNYVVDETEFVGVDWRSVKFENCYYSFKDYELRYVNLDYLDFTDANLANSDFSEVSCVNTNFTRANLCEANFEGCNLTGASFSGADLRWANFSNANLTGAILIGADTYEAKFHSAIMTRSTSPKGYLHS
jgi:uncharacterized protein YjbI with pentapeptide repeats